jgi:hypothetical protein
MQRRAAGALLPLAAVGLLLTGAAVAASLSTPQLRPAPLPKFTPHPPNDPNNSQPPPLVIPKDAGPPPPGIELPSWVGPLVLAILAALVAGLVVLTVWLLLRNRSLSRRVGLPEPEPAGEQEQREAVLAAVDAGLVDLDDGDPRAAVIACWVRLEEAAAAAGTPRAPGDTPAELVLRLLAGHQVSPEVLYPLAEVYRLARYATHTVDVTMRDQARVALRQVRAELSRPAPAPAPAGGELAGSAGPGREVPR